MKNLQQKEHFSHHHVLIPLMLDEGEEINCSGCETLIHEPFHGCIPCNFFLHDGCLNTSRFLQHSSHPYHPLTLLPKPTYPGRFFTCKACGSIGKSFSFSCAKCAFDLHIQCASLPESFLMKDQHPHELKLVFKSPYEDKNSTFVCDVCGNNMNPDEWLYYCQGCDYAAHLGCSGAAAGTAGNGGEGKIAEEEEKQHNGGKEGADYQKSVFEAQKEMKKTHIANQAMLQALDNAASYVGPSYNKYYYY